MSIYATALTVQNYRSFAEYELVLHPGITILVGPNAAGKTNLVESLQLLTAGQSFRRPTPRDLVREGCEAGGIRLALAGEGRRLEMGCDFAQGRRSFLRNGKKTASAGVRGVLPSVLFCPDHLDMVKRSASVRRAALDDFGTQLNEQYARLVATYERIVEQRNSLLKERPLDRALLAAWDESLVASGASLMMHRMALLARVRSRFAEVYSAIAPHEAADVSYEASACPAAHAPVPGDRDGIEAALRRSLVELADDEVRRGMTLTGPHRDELVFTIDGRPARAFGSQGQQRSIVLAWKIAEVAVTRDILGRPPLLLLDDVMSELDAARRSAVLEFIGDEIQTVITTTNLGYFEGNVLDRAKVVEIGAISR